MISLFYRLNPTLFALLLTFSLCACYPHQGQIHRSNNVMPFARQACYRNDEPAARVFLNRLIADPQEDPRLVALAETSLQSPSLCVALESQLAELNLDFPSAKSDPK